MFIIEEFCNENGKRPFKVWLDQLDFKFQARVLARIARFEKGNFGDHKKVTKDIHEARFFFGPGFRLYFVKLNGRVVLLLCGGDKNTQSKDIRKAEEYLSIYLKESEDA